MKIAVLLGGTSTEHEISLLSGQFIVETLAKSHHVKPVVISRHGDWYVPEEYGASLPQLESLAKDFADRYLGLFIEKNRFRSQRGVGVQHLDCDIVYLGLHGGEGENGCIQGLLQACGIPYTGSGVMASALAMDKERANYLFQANGMSVAPFYAFQRLGFSQETFAVCQNLRFPVFIKPTEGGSSVSTARVDSFAEAYAIVEKLLQRCDKIMVQELTQGREFSCGVFESTLATGKEVVALPITEIIPGNDFFDYESKYQAGKSQEITPANLDPTTSARIQGLSVQAHQLLGCSGYSRSDFILRQEDLYILETNTLPGMTATSLVPQQAKAMGLSMQELFDIILQSGLSR
ncbi:MAG: D-alanine--D-alanine ligase [Spirochaetota bacterium]